jgi:2-methylisocitrate lyase-like PEP mutase family enzyme
MCTTAAPRRIGGLLLDERVMHCLGVYDGISIAAAEAAGAGVLYLSGYALSASALGLPDNGLMTQTEMHEAIARLCAQTDLPLIADADTGYGDLSQVARTMKLWERAGVAGLHLEDQVFPKTCAQTGDVLLASAEEMSRRIEAAVNARARSEVMVIARTDALAHETVDQVAERCARYAQSGADALFINAPGSRQAFAQLADKLRPLLLPLVFNAVHSRRTPSFTDEELASLGVRFVLHPVDALVEASRRLGEVYASLVRGEAASTTESFLSLTATLSQRHRLRG